MYKLMHRLCSMAPVEVGPWWHSRKYVCDKMAELGVKAGDIVCRCGNAAVYGFIPFSNFICHLTHSQYSHAALVLDSADGIMLADVSTTGLHRMFVADWCDDIRGDDILVLRHNGDPSVIQLVVENAKTILNLDPSYEDEFIDEESCRNFYCVELVCWCYLRAGVMLCQDIPIRELPGWKKWYNVVAKLHGIDYTAPVWCVGNEKIGLLSSPHLTEVGRIPFQKLRKYRHRITFAGA